jgi:hypothetical protein
VRGAGSALDDAGYAQLAKPSKAVPPMTFRSVAPNLFERIIDQTVSGSQKAGAGVAWCPPVQPAGRHAREPHLGGDSLGRSPRSSPPAVSAFPGRVAGSACTSSFSRLARRSLALPPAHSRGHQFVTRYPKASDISSPPCLLRLLPAGANRRVGLAPTGKRRLVTAHTHSGPSAFAVGTALRAPLPSFTRARTHAPSHAVSLDLSRTKPS